MSETMYPILLFPRVKIPASNEMSPTVLLFIKTCALDLSEFNYSGNSEIRTFELTYSRKIQEIKKQQHISVCIELIFEVSFLSSLEGIILGSGQ